MIRHKIVNSYTGLLILVNVIVFIGFYLAVLLLNVPELQAISYIAIQPAMFLAGKNLWTIITHIFMHAGFIHLFANMISLMFIGGFVEKLVGKKRFLLIYFGGGLAAALLFILVALITGNSLNTFAVGASGAIFALGGVLAVLTPRLPVLVFFVLPLPMWAAMFFLLGVMWVISITANVPIGNIAHLGGLLIGIAYGFYLRKKYPRKTQMISRYFS